MNGNANVNAPFAIDSNKGGKLHKVFACSNQKFDTPEFRDGLRNPCANAARPVS
jgi:hypothetical protein